MGSFMTQLKQVLRRLVRTPMFTAVTLITLAAGVGANTVVFSVLESVLLKPLPYPKPAELISVHHSAPGLNIQELVAAPSNYFIYREQNRTFQDIGLYDDDSENVTGVAEPEQVRALLVTDGTLPLLGIPPMLGRWFSRQDDLPNSPKTVMLGYGFWQRKFGGDRSIVGKTIHVDGEQREIIGVMPQRFQFLAEEDPALFTPFQFDRSKTHLGNFSYRALARLKPGATLDDARADVARMLPIVWRSFPAPEGFSLQLFEKADVRPNVRPLKDRVVGDVGKALWVLMGSIGMVLLIACANVANLVLVRVEGRRQELAVRAALGARWSRIAYELMLESVVLGMLGGVVGLALAYAALRFLVALSPSGLPRIHQVGIDAPVLLFTFVIALLASLLFGAVPLFKYAGDHLSTGLREGSRGLSHSREQHRARNILVIVQVALALVLLVCSGLMVRTFRALTKVNSGFGPAAEVQTFRLSIPEAAVKEEERVARLHEEILRKLAAVPGVSAAAAGSVVPMDGNGSFDPIFAEDHTYAPGELPPVRRFKFMSPGYLGTLGTPLITGRDITWADIYNRVPVTLVSENLAREYWHSPTGALGKRIRVGANDNWREIVGVVGNVYDDGVSRETPTSVYWPMMMYDFEGQKQMVRRDLAFVLRTPRAGSENLMKEVRQAVWSVDPNLPLASVRTLDYYYRNSMARTSFTLLMLAVAGAMALLLGTVGIYGVVAYSVSQRTREIGIRMALGAQRQELTGMFVRNAFLLTAVGVACGLAVAVLLSRLMTSLLFNVSPVDLITYSAVSIALVATALLASYLPSRRAAAVDPVEALRAE
jgi:predicted permease